MESSDLETSNLHMHRNYRMHFVKEFTIEEQTLLTEEHTNLQPSTILLSKIVRSPRASGNLLCSLRTNLVIVIRSVRMASAAWSMATSFALPSGCSLSYDLVQQTRQIIKIHTQRLFNIPSSLYSSFNFPLGYLKLLPKALVATDRISFTVHITTQWEEIDKDELLLKTIKPQSKSNAQQIQ